MNDKTDISGSDKDLFAGKARVRLLDDNVPFYPAPESKTAPIKRLKKGDNFYLVGKEAHGMSEIVLLDSHIGFVENKVRILYLDRFDCWYKRTDFLSSNTVEMLMYGIFNLEYWTSPFKHAVVILDKDKLVINDFWKSVTLDTIPIKEISEIYSGRFGQALRLRIVTIRSLVFGGLAAIGSILLLAFNGVGGGVAVVGAISIGLGLAFLVFIFSFLHTFGKLGRKPIKLDFLTVEGRRVSVVISQRSKQCEHAADVLQANGLIVAGAPRV
jgi:hypothetical protein